MALESTQKAKLTLRAQDLTLTTDVTNDYYLTVKLQYATSNKELKSPRSVTMADYFVVGETSSVTTPVGRRRRGNPIWLIPVWG